MKRSFKIFSILLTTGFVFSCTTLDIPPKTILWAEDVYATADGVETLIVNLYRRLPMDDFNVTSDDRGTDTGQSKEGYYGWNSNNPIESTTGELSEGFKYGHEVPDANESYWGEGWKLIRDANMIIDDLANPAYSGNHQAADIAAWIAEAKFIRAYTYWQMARRFGGLPIITSPQQYDQSDITTLHVPRSSSVDTYDFIIDDCDAAIAGMSTAVVHGRANQWAARVLKMRVALTAAAIAKYGADFIYMSKVDPSKMLCGIPLSEANRYYETAWRVAREFEGGPYSLAGAGASTPEAQEAAFASIWENAEGNGESIFIRQYGALANTHVHSFDMFYAFGRMGDGGQSRYSVNLDWMELFDGGALSEREDGRINTSYIGEDGKEYYKVYNSSGEIYEGMEPRLLASIMVPGRRYPNGFMVDYRVGTIIEEWDPATPIEVGTKDDYTGGGDRKWDTNGDYGWWFWGDGYGGIRDRQPNNPTGRLPYVRTYNGGENPTSQNPNQNIEIKDNNGTVVLSFTRWGLEGPNRPTGGGENSLSGINGRKWLDVHTSGLVMDKSTTPWVDMRYAEVLLGRAEAAIELHQGSNQENNVGIPAVTQLDGVIMQQDAFDQINAVRSRAGATLLSSPAELSTDPSYNRPPRGNYITNPNPGKGSFMIAPNRGIQILRVEHLKEFFMERKPYWAYRRWFILRAISEGGFYRRGLYPILFAKGATATYDAVPNRVPAQIMDGKYIYIRAMATSWGDANIQYPDHSGVYYLNLPDLNLNPLMEGNARQ